MTTAVDTNVIITLWDRDLVISSPARAALDNAFSQGPLVVSAPVLSELLASPGRTEEFVDAFLEDTGITIEIDLDEAIWRVAGRAFQVYAARRRKQSQNPLPRRILADFLIGAHALERGYSLLTLDDHLYRTSFSGLEIITFN